jgi:hypothetical protein
MPLPRRVLYDITVNAISANGVWSLPAIAQAQAGSPVVVGAQPASRLPGIDPIGAGVVNYIDPSGSYQQARTGGRVVTACC